MILYRRSNIVFFMSVVCQNKWLSKLVVTTLSYRESQVSSGNTDSAAAGNRNSAREVMTGRSRSRSQAEALATSRTQKDSNNRSPSRERTSNASPAYKAAALQSSMR